VEVLLLRVAISSDLPVSIRLHWKSALVACEKKL
jgi:hypothetical protein